MKNCKLPKMANISTQKILTGITEKDLKGTAMSKDKYSYLALFTYEEDGISIEFPDLPGCYPCAVKTIPTKPLEMQKRLLDFISGAWNRIMKSFRSLL